MDDDNTVTQVYRKDSNNNENLYTASRIEADGNIVGILHIAAPRDRVDTAIQERVVALGLGVGVLSLLAIGVSVFIFCIIDPPFTRPRILSTRFFQRRFWATGSKRASR